MRAFAKQAGAAEAEDLQLWDTGFWSERLREAKYDLREEELRPYFQLPAVIEGMFGLASDLFGVTVEKADGESEVWHKDVSFFRVRDGATGALADGPSDARGGEDGEEEDLTHEGP